MPESDEPRPIILRIKNIQFRNNFISVISYTKKELCYVIMPVINKMQPCNNDCCEKYDVRNKIQNVKFR